MAKDELVKHEQALFFRSDTEADQLLGQIVTTAQRVEVQALRNREAAKQALLARDKATGSKPERNHA